MTWLISTFADYCVAYRILEPALAATLHGLPSQEFTLGRTVADLTKQRGRSVTVNEFSKRLGWKSFLVYKHVKRAVKHRLLGIRNGYSREKREAAPSECGLQRWILAQPHHGVRNNPKIGSEVRYVDRSLGAPTNTPVILRRRKRVDSKGLGRRRTTMRKMKPH